MRTTNLLIVALLLLFAIAAHAGSRRQSLDRTTTIAGYPCARGYAWFYANGKLDTCTLAAESRFGEATLPAGSLISLDEAGQIKSARMSHDTRIRGLLCRGGGPLGPGEGDMVAFYPSGKLREIFLAEDQSIDGVPCAHGGLGTTLRHGDPRVVLNEDGSLRSCRLARDFGGQKQNNRFTATPAHPSL